MGMTITEKILAEKSGKKHVKPGEIVEVTVDRTFSHDIFSPGVIAEFNKKNRPLKNRDGIILITDHELPAVSGNAGLNYRIMSEFAQKHRIKHFYYGEGVCHQVIPEKGHVLPGDIIIGTDSHTVTYGALTAFSTGIGSNEMAGIWAEGKIWLKVPETVRFHMTGKLQEGVYSKDLILYVIGLMKADGCTYKAVEFSGETIQNLSMDARFTLTNMVVEMGAKNGIIGFDSKTEAYLTERGIKNYRVHENDSDAEFSEVHRIDASQIPPMAAGPEGVDDIKEISTLAGKKINQVFIGSCTNGRYEDLAIAASILKNKKIAPYIKLIITPASKSIYMKAMETGLIKIFMDSGAVVTNPSCGLCYGVSGGVLSKGEVAICSNNRNFPGRLGHKDAEIYLTSPSACALSALKGEIVSSF